MSSEPQAIPQFLTINALKSALKSTDTLDDETFLFFVNDANKRVHTSIFPYIDTPLERGSIYWSRCADAAMTWARSMHAEDNELLEKSMHYVEKFNLEMYGKDDEHGLVQEFKATRTNRTRTVLVRRDPRNNKVPLTTQNDLFVSQDFG